MAQNMMGALHQQLAHIRIAAFGNAQLRVARATRPLLRPQSQKPRDIAAVRESLGAAQRQHEGQRGEPADTGNTFQLLQFRMLLGQPVDLSMVAGDLAAEGVDLLEQAGQRCAQKIRQRVGGARAERRGDRLGQAHTEPFGDAARTVDQQRARPQDRIARPDHGQFRLLFGRAMFHRRQQPRVGPRQQSQLARIHGIVLGVARGDPLQLAWVGHDDLVAQPLQLAADPGRLRSGLQCDPPRLAAEMFFEGTRLVAKDSFFHHLAVLIEDAIAADFVAQIDPDGLAHPRWHFAKLLHGWFLLCTSSSAFISLTADQVSQPSHPICPRHGIIPEGEARTHRASSGEPGKRGLIPLHRSKHRITEGWTTVFITGNTALRGTWVVEENQFCRIFHRQRSEQELIE